ncbi:MAG: B12-binding domain-containing radical SAM protein [Clostridia bacterium]|nr:B12-binding domain-containing radical SAM protein [Clostridia bacterium]
MERITILLMYVQRMVYKRTFEYLDNLGLMSIAAFLEDNGYRARVFTGITTDAVKVFEEESRKYPIFAVGLYCDYDNQSAVVSMSLILKEKYGVRVLVGGPQALHVGEEFLKAARCDFLIRGDGEYVIRELLDWMAWGRGTPANIKGIVYLDEAGLEVSTPERPPIDDLVALPAPSSQHLLRRPHKYNLSVASARGCPFRCTFCFEGGNTKKLRLRSVESVKEEIIRGLDENPEIKYIWFVDDTFTISYDRIALFCEVMSDLRSSRDFVWFCEGHASILSRWPQLVSMMKDAGMVRMQIGMEAGWQSALDMYGKQTTVEQIEEVVHLCWECDLPQLAGNFIIGGVHETKETLEFTSTYIEKLLIATPGLLDISTTFVIPLPNTAISNYPHDFGLNILDRSSLTSLEDFPVTETLVFSREELCHERYKFVKMLSDTMKYLLKSNKIPHGRLKKHFELALRYGVSSTWYKYLYTKDTAIRRYYTMLITTPAKRLEEILPSELKNWYPCRVFDIEDKAGWSNGRPALYEATLSPIEYELLLLCSGKINLNSIQLLMEQRHPDGLSGDQLCNSLEGILKTFQERHWVLFMPP